MRIIYGARVETELRRAFQESQSRFGVQAAEATLAKIDHVLNVALPEQPRMGRFLARKGAYRLAISRTPFIAYYHLDEARDEIAVLAIFHGAQDRAEFEG